MSPARRDTGPEMNLRRELHSRGLRYSVQARPIPQVRRTADLLFRRFKVAVFVDGCFWHGCPQHAWVPISSGRSWADAIERTRIRDQDTDELLARNGWESVRVWSHDPPGFAADHVESRIRARSGYRSRAYRQELRRA